MKTKNVFHCIGLAVVLIVAGIAAFINSQGLDTITVTKAQIVEKMQEKLPITKSVPFYNVTIKDVTLDLGEDRMNVLVNIVAVKKESTCAKGFTTKSAKMNKFLRRFKDKCEIASTEPSRIEILAAGSLDYNRPRYSSGRMVVMISRS